MAKIIQRGTIWIQWDFSNLNHHELQRATHWWKKLETIEQCHCWKDGRKGLIQLSRSKYQDFCRKTSQNIERGSFKSFKNFR